MLPLKAGPGSFKRLLGAAATRTHDLPMLGVRSKWAHAARLEVGAIGVIHLQVERVIGDQGEKAIARVDADTAEHAPGADTWDHAAQLVDDEGSEARADWHKT